MGLFAILWVPFYFISFFKKTMYFLFFKDCKNTVHYQTFRQYRNIHISIYEVKGPHSHSCWRRLVVPDVLPDITTPLF